MIDGQIIGGAAHPVTGSTRPGRTSGVAQTVALHPPTTGSSGTRVWAMLQITLRR